MQLSRTQGSEGNLAAVAASVLTIEGRPPPLRTQCCRSSSCNPRKLRNFSLASFVLDRAAGGHGNRSKTCPSAHWCRRREYRICKTRLEIRERNADQIMRSK